MRHVPRQQTPPPPRVFSTSLQMLRGSKARYMPLTATIVLAAGTVPVTALLYYRLDTSYSIRSPRGCRNHLPRRSRTVLAKAPELSKSGCTHALAFTQHHHQSVVRTLHTLIKPASTFPCTLRLGELMVGCPRLPSLRLRGRPNKARHLPGLGTVFDDPHAACTPSSLSATAALPRRRAPTC